MGFNDFWISNGGKKKQLHDVKNGVRKEQVDKKHHNLFDAYDLNNNGILENNELQTIFGHLKSIAGTDNTFDDNENTLMKKWFTEQLGLQEVDFQSFLTSISNASSKIIDTEETELPDGGKSIKTAYEDGMVMTSEYYSDGSWKSNKLEVDPRRFVVYQTESGLTLKVTYWKRDKDLDGNQNAKYYKISATDVNGKVLSADEIAKHFGVKKINDGYIELDTILNMGEDKIRFLIPGKELAVSPTVTSTNSTENDISSTETNSADVTQYECSSRYLLNKLGLDINTEDGRKIQERFSKLPQELLDLLGDGEELKELLTSNELTLTFDNLSNVLEIVYGITLRNEEELKETESQRDRLITQIKAAEILTNLYETIAQFNDQYTDNLQLFGLGSEGFGYLLNKLGIQGENHYQWADSCREFAQRAGELKVLNPEKFNEGFKKIYSKDGKYGIDFNLEAFKELIEIVDAGKVTNEKGEPTEEYKDAVLKACNFVVSNPNDSTYNQVINGFGEALIMIMTLGLGTLTKGGQALAFATINTLSKKGVAIASKQVSNKLLQGALRYSGKAVTLLGPALNEGTKMATYTLATGTISNITNRTIKFDSEENTLDKFLDTELMVFNGTTDSFGFGAFAGVFGTTVTQAVVNRVSKTSSNVINALKENFSKGAVNADEVYAKVLEKSIPTVLGECSGFAIDVVGFTAFETALTIYKNADENITVDGLTELLWEEFKGQNYNLGQIKIISHLIMWMSGSRSARMNSAKYLRENLPQLKGTTIEQKGETYKINLPDGRKIECKNADEMISSLHLMVRGETVFNRKFDKPKTETNTPRVHENDQINHVLVSDEGIPVVENPTATRNSQRPEAPLIKDPFNTSKHFTAEELNLSGKDLVLEVNGKKSLTEEGEAILRRTAHIINETANSEIAEVVGLMNELGLSPTSQRVKKEQSIYDKLKNEFFENDKTTLSKAIDNIRDSVGVRTVRNVMDFTSHPEVKRCVEEGDMQTALQKAVELESAHVLECLKQYIDNFAAGKTKLKLIKISNYVGENGIPYFTEKQLNELKVYADAKGVKLPIFERVNTLAERINGESNDIYAPKSTTKIRESGYTALQMNFEAENGFIYEWQNRGEKVNEFAEGEHVPYDLRTNKDIIGSHKELESIYQPMKDILTNKEVFSDEMFTEYNNYLTAYYEYLRLEELGFNDGKNPPKLPSGFDARLRAENLILLHKYAEKIKDESAREKEFVQEYESLLTQNTPENTTTESYTEAARVRNENRTINIYEASRRIGENNGVNSEKKYSSIVIKACRNEKGAIVEELVSRAEELQSWGVSDELIAKVINKTKNVSFDSARNALKDLQKKYPNYTPAILVGLLEISISADGKIDFVKLESVIDFCNQTNVKTEIISHVYDKISTNPEIREPAIKICQEVINSKVGYMKNIESVKSIINACFTPDGKVDNNAVDLCIALINSNVDYSKIETLLYNARTRGNASIVRGGVVIKKGVITNEYKNFILDLLKDTNNLQDTRLNPASNSYMLLEITKMLTVINAKIKKNPEGKDIVLCFIEPDSNLMSVFKDTMKRRPKNEDETLGQYLLKITSIITGSKDNEIILKDFYSKGLFLDIMGFSYKNIKEILAAAQNDKSILNKIDTIYSSLPSEVLDNIVSVDMKLESNVIKLTTVDNNNTTIVRDFDRNTLDEIGKYEIKTNTRGTKTIKESDDETRGYRSRVKYYNGRAIEETTVVTDPITGEKMGVEYLTHSQVQGLFNIQYRDLKTGETKVLSSAHIDEFGTLIVKKDYQSLDGTQTKYSYQENADGSYTSEYKIIDETGKILLNENRSFTVIDNKHCESSCNGKKYFMTISEDNILYVTNEAGKTVRFDLDEFSNYNMNDKAFIDLFQRIPGHEFFYMAEVGTKSIKRGNVINNAHYNSGTNEIRLGINHDSLPILLHEFGHNKDCRLDKNNPLQKDATLNAIYEQERDAFVKEFPQFRREFIDYFIDLDNVGDKESRGISECIAESNMLLNTALNNQLAFRGEYLRRYFPKTIAYIARALNPAIYK